MGYEILITFLFGAIWGLIGIVNASGLRAYNSYWLTYTKEYSKEDCLRVSLLEDVLWGFAGITGLISGIILTKFYKAGFFLSKPFYQYKKDIPKNLIYNCNFHREINENTIYPIIIEPYPDHKLYAVTEADMVFAYMALIEGSDYVGRR